MSLVTIFLGIMEAEKSGLNSSLSVGGKVSQIVVGQVTSISIKQKTDGI
jgi:hypothetical protein